MPPAYYQNFNPNLQDNEDERPQPQERPAPRYQRIVIIGMPCSGKSSIGKIIAAHYGMQFYDLDDEIVKEAGMSIEQIFRTYGETRFREIETQVTERVSKLEMAVIATGGGIVTKPDNMAYLKREGSIVMYIHRDFYKIATTPKRIMEKRPVLQNTSYTKLLELYKKRLPLYKKYADCEVRNDTNKEDSVRRIVEILDRMLYGDGNVEVDDEGFSY